MNVTVLGCGRWGTFLAWYCDKLNHKTTLWGRKDSNKLKYLREHRKNDFLTLRESVNLSDDLESAAKNAKFIIISISSQSLRDLAKKLSKFDLKEKTIILCMKGIEVNTGKRLTQVMKEYITDADIAIWVGPGHVQSFVKDVPNCMVIDSENEIVTDDIVNAFSSKLIRLYKGEDLIGNEIGAAAKNVIGIAAGMLDAFNYQSLKGALMARGAREVSRLISKMGGNELSAYGLSHLGDYEATLFSPFSNNRRFGEEFAKGKRDFSYLAEGVTTAKALITLSEKYDVEMPISKTVYKTIEFDLPMQKMLDELFSRSVKKEFYK